MSCTHSLIWVVVGDTSACMKRRQDFQKVVYLICTHSYEGHKPAALTITGDLWRDTLANQMAWENQTWSKYLSDTLLGEH